MKETWFFHMECTTEQAEELLAQYRRRGVKVERSLNPDFITWTVSAQLPEGNHSPRPSRVWQSKAWG
nr:MAG TPA_asm: Glyoxalase/bleomycin resistance protein [Caudoviricetes sp.]